MDTYLSQREHSKQASDWLVRADRQIAMAKKAPAYRAANEVPSCAYTQVCCSLYLLALHMYLPAATCYHGVFKRKVAKSGLPGWGSTTVKAKPQINESGAWFTVWSPLGYIQSK